MVLRINLLFAFLAFSLFSPAGAKINKDSVSVYKRNITKYFIHKPDSAILNLRRFLAFKNEFSDSLLARTYNKMGVSFGQLERQDSARSYFRKAAEVADRAKMKGNIYHNWAQSERFAGNYDSAFQVLDQAERYYRNSQFFRGLGMVYTERGTVYMNKRRLDEAIPQLNEAVALFKKIKDSDYIIYAQQELANCYIQNDKFAFAFTLYKELLPRLKRTNSINYFSSLYNYGKCLIHKKAIDEAEQVYQQTLDFFRENGRRKFYYAALGQLGKISALKGKPTEAAQQYAKAFYGLWKLKSNRLESVTMDYLNLLYQMKQTQKALKVIRQFEEQSSEKVRLSERDHIAFLEVAGKVFAANNLFKKAYTATHHAAFLKDSMRGKENRLRMDSLQAKYRQKYQLQQNRLLSQSLQMVMNKNRRKQILILVGAVVLVIILIGARVIYKKQRKKIQLEQEVAVHLDEAKQNLESKLAVERTLLEERKQKLKDQERELVANSLQIAHVKNAITAVVKQKGENSSVHQLKRRLKAVLHQLKDWDLFRKKFVEVYPDFLEQIKKEHPTLTNKDLDFCALVKLNLSNKEIATLLNISHQSVITKKYRLRKKIGSSRETDTLEDWIASF
ncbi:MAG TPA: hypothetical protein VK084_10215 [Chitinophagaceae bacterium]|nr:hypothetical protein [Chitinophagaceae bacterium]